MLSLQTIWKDSSGTYNPTQDMKAQTPHQFALKCAGRFPKCDPEKSRYDLNYWDQSRERVEPFKNMTATEQGTSPILFWKQGTPNTRLGYVFQYISVIGKSGHGTLEDVWLDGLRNIMEVPFGPDRYSQLDRAMTQYNTATRFFKQYMPFFTA